MGTVSRQLGISDRTLWRWLQAESAPAEKAAWQPSEEDLVAYARWAADASAAWRERPDEGADC